MFTLLLQMVKDRLQIFRTSLISEGKTSALMHGLLAFFKHVFADFRVVHVGESAILKEEFSALEVPVIGVYLEVILGDVQHG